MVMEVNGTHSKINLIQGTHFEVEDLGITSGKEFDVGLSPSRRGFLCLISLKYELAELASVASYLYLGWMGYPLNYSTFSSQVGIKRGLWTACRPDEYERRFAV